MSDRILNTVLNHINVANRHGSYYYNKHFDKHCNKDYHKHYKKHYNKHYNNFFKDRHDKLQENFKEIK